MMRWTLVCAVALAGCSGDKDETTGPTGTTPDDELITSFTVVPGPIPGVMIATLETTEPVTATVAYGLTGGSLDTSIPTVTAEGTTHTMTVLGVKTGKQYDFQAQLTVAGEAATSDVVTAQVTPATVSVPTFSVKVWEPSLACTPDGFVLLSYLGANNSGIAVLDRDGDIVWSLPYANTNVQLSRSRPGLDGTSFTYTTADGDRKEEIGQIVRQPLDGSAATVTYTNRSHHDYVELPSGDYGWLSYEFDPAYDNCSQGDTPTQETALDAIFESSPGATNDEAVEIYSMIDSYPHPLDCSIDDETFLKATDRFDIVHSNSLMYRPSDDSYMHMSRWQDMLMKVDRATGTHVWNFGGPFNDFTPVAGQDVAELFNHSHMSEVWDDGMIIFNNNDFGPVGKGPSIVQEVVLDETAMTWDVVWSWTSDQGFEALLGDARRMPQPECDNVLVSLSGSGIVRELTRDGQVAWGAGAPLGNVTSRVHFIPDIYDVTTALR
jgi:hypothetical protein